MFLSIVQLSKSYLTDVNCTLSLSLYLPRVLNRLDFFPFFCVYYYYCLYVVIKYRLCLLLCSWSNVSIIVLSLILSNVSLHTILCCLLLLLCLLLFSPLHASVNIVYRQKKGENSRKENIKMTFVGAFLRNNACTLSIVATRFLVNRYSLKHEKYSCPLNNIRHHSHVLCRYIKASSHFIFKMSWRDVHRNKIPNHVLQCLDNFLVVSVEKWIPWKFLSFLPFSHSQLSFFLSCNRKILSTF